MSDSVCVYTPFAPGRPWVTRLWPYAYDRLTAGCAPARIVWIDDTQNGQLPPRPPSPSYTQLRGLAKPVRRRDGRAVATRLARHWRTAAAAAGRAAWLLCLEDDVLPPVGTLAELLEVARAGQFDILGTPCRSRQRSGHVMAYRHSGGRLKVADEHRLYDVDSINLCCTLVSRRAADLPVGPVGWGRNGHDFSLCELARNAGMRVGCHGGLRPRHLRKPFRRVLVTGCGRSGTMFAAHLLQHLGLQVGHERVGPDGAVGWQFAGDGLCPHYTRRGQRSEHDWGVVLHQIRHPLDVIASTVWMHPPQYDWIANQVGGLPDRSDMLHVAAAHWLKWNRLAESVADWTYRVESLRPGTKTMETWCRMIGVSEPAQMPVSTKTNSKPHAPLTWADLDRLPGRLVTAIREQAERYGYTH